MLLQHNPPSVALVIVVRFFLQYPPIPIYEEWMSPWTNVSTLKTLCMSMRIRWRGKTCGWLHCSTQVCCWCRLLQARAPASSQLGAGWSTASLQAWPGTAVLFPEKASLLARNSIGTSLEMSTNKWNITAAKTKVLSPSCLWQTLKNSSSLKLLPWIYGNGFHIHPLFFSFGKGTGSVHINTIAKSLCNYFSTVVTHQFE